MNGLLLALPESPSAQPWTGSSKTEVVRPDEEEVYEVDPSESVRSDEIMGLIEERFEIVYRADFGGTLLQFVLSDIAGNFDPADPKDVAMIDLVCLYEKTLIDEGVLPSDFVYLVAKRLPEPRLSRRRRARAGAVETPGGSIPRWLMASASVARGTSRGRSCSERTVESAPAAPAQSSRPCTARA